MEGGELYNRIASRDTPFTERGIYSHYRIID